VRRVLILLFLAGTLASAFLLLAPRGPRTETFFEIAPGTSSRQIATQLERQGLIWSRYGFDALRLAKGGTLKAGEYRFDHPAAVSEVYGRIVRGDVYTRSLTIPEGSNVFDIANRVEEGQFGSKEAFLLAVRQQVGLISDLDPRATTLEGYLFPDTYHFQRSVRPEQIVQAMVRRFRQAAAGIGLEGDDHRVVTLASLVERESPIAQERPLVASVFENRLAKGMALMTDPTVIYAALIAGTYHGTIFQSGLAAESPYNTYKHVGLPPGPICNPGLDSLKAAMAPAHTDYLYFVAATADPSGRSRFAKTLEEHAQNVQAYRRSLHRNREQ
jgi:UPF0755 protein